MALHWHAVLDGCSQIVYWAYWVFATSSSPGSLSHGLHTVQPKLCNFALLRPWAPVYLNPPQVDCIHYQ